VPRSSRILNHNLITRASSRTADGVPSVVVLRYAIGNTPISWTSRPVDMFNTIQAYILPPCILLAVISYNRAWTGVENGFPSQTHAFPNGLAKTTHTSSHFSVLCSRRGVLSPQFPLFPLLTQGFYTIFSPFCQVVPYTAKLCSFPLGNTFGVLPILC